MTSPKAIPRAILCVMLVSWCHGAFVSTRREECFHRHYWTDEDNPEHEILCSVDGTPSYEVTTVPGRYYNLYCKSDNVLNEKNLPHAHLKSTGGPPKSYFLFSHCPLPSTSYADVMRHLGVTATPKLMIRRLQSSDPIEKRHLKGLDELRIKTLNLYDNAITDVPEDLFQDLPNLMKLELSTNKLLVSGRIFKDLKKLRVLMASDAELADIPEDLFALPSLEKLYLSWNSLKLTSRTFHGAASLKTLDLSSNSLKSLPRDVFQDLINLRQVDLSNNPLTAIPRGLFKHNKKMVTLLMDTSCESLEDTLHELEEATGCDFVENDPGQFVKRCIENNARYL